MPRIAWTLSLLVALTAVLAGGCSLSVRTIGADSVEDFQAEEAYKSVYAEQMARVEIDLQLFAASGSNPGVCNSGGSKQGCFDADTKSIQGLQAMQVALDAIPVPPRYVAGDKLLRDAIAANLRGLQLRNDAIVNGDDAAWVQHKVALDEAIATYNKAYLAFPEDNRPQPAP